MTLDTKYLSKKKNLLAFSAGIDSSALFFLLIENNIKFDIAIVDYGIREQSKQEVAHAKALAKKYKLFCHTIRAPKFESHFEKYARDFRYEFFDSLVTIEGYDNILTAHQLNDQLEWLLMRFTKGAGLTELLGLETFSQRENYILIRPLLNYSKQELLKYLKENKYPYFIDKSNKDIKYERNKFRLQYADMLLDSYEEGIRRTFSYLHKDKITLESYYELIFQEKYLFILKLENTQARARAADFILKKLGYLLSAPQRHQIEKEKSIVIGGSWAIESRMNLLYIAPYIHLSMPKKFKELCRENKIPAKIRPYILKENIDPEKCVFHSIYTDTGNT